MGTDCQASLSQLIEKRRQERKEAKEKECQDMKEETYEPGYIESFRNSFSSWLGGEREEVQTDSANQQAQANQFGELKATAKQRLEEADLALKEKAMDLVANLQKKNVK